MPLARQLASNVPAIPGRSLVVTATGLIFGGKSISIGGNLEDEQRQALGLRSERSDKLTRRIHILLWALCFASQRTPDRALPIRELWRLEHWGKQDNIVRLIANELRPHDRAAITRRGRGPNATLRIGESWSIECAEPPPSVLRLVDEILPPTPEGPLADASQDVDPNFGEAVARALREIRIGEFMLDTHYEYECGKDAMVFAGIAIRTITRTPLGEPVALPVIVKAPITLRSSVSTGGSSEAMDVQRDRLHAEHDRLVSFAGHPCVPAVRLVDVDLSVPLLKVLRAHSIGFRSADLRMPLLIELLAPPRTIEAIPRRLASYIADRHRQNSRRTRREIRNVLYVAEHLATALRVFHARGWAHQRLTVDTVFVRSEFGLIEGILAPDLSAAVTVRHGNDRLLFRDLFHLGSLLVHMVTGKALIADERDFRPPEFSGALQVRDLVSGEREIVARILFAIARLLLEARPDDAAPRSPTVALLDSFLNELEHIRGLQWRRARGTPERQLSPAGESSRRDTWLRSNDDTVTTSLFTLLHIVDAKTLDEWCARYVTRDEIDDDPEEPHSISAAIGILRLGRGRVAARILSELLHAAPALPENDEERERQTRDEAKALRNLATHWLREDLPERIHPILDHLVARPAAPEQINLWHWIHEVGRRTGWPRAKEVSRPDPGDKRITDLHLWQWLRAGAVNERKRAALADHRQGRDAIVSAKDIRELMSALHGTNAPAAVFGANVLATLLLLQALSPSDERGRRWDRAVAQLLSAASVSATREMPHEMAATLRLAASFTTEALGDSELCAALAARGVDFEDCRIQAAECALVAADAYLRLDNQLHHVRSLLDAAALLLRSRFPERIVQGFQLLSLARNHRLLPWEPPSISRCRESHEPNWTPPLPRVPVGEPDPYRTEPALAASPDEREPDRTEPTNEVSSDGRESARTKPARTEPASEALRLKQAEQKLEAREQELAATGLKVWQNVRDSVRTSEDIGTVLEHAFFSRYTKGIQEVFGTEGLQVEIAGGVVDHLLARARDWWGRPDASADPRAHESTSLRIIDIGCGTGKDALALAARHRVVAVESPAWFASLGLPRATTEKTRRNLEVIAEDLVGFAQRIKQKGEPFLESFDVVLFRCSLAHVQDRLALLEAATRLLVPGGLVAVSDWVQAQTAERTAWYRLLDAIRFVGLETAPGYSRLCEQVGLKQFYVEPRQPDMHAFFKARLDHLKGSGMTRAPSHSAPARALMLRARRDLETLVASTAPGAPLGWMFWVAHKA